MNSVYDQSFGAKVPTYNLVLQLDRKLRGFHVPAILQIAGFGHSDTRGGAVHDSVPLILQRHLVLAIREARTCCSVYTRLSLWGLTYIISHHRPSRSTLYVESPDPLGSILLCVSPADRPISDMHRGFFAKAISEHSTDPLGSPYGSSFIAAYRSAGSLVALVRNIHSQLKELSERMWFFWTHLFSCSVSAISFHEICHRAHR